MASTQMSTTANQFLSAFSFIGFVLCAIPLPWHLEAWNTGTCVYMFWAGLGCFNWFINSVIWNKHAINVAPVWCDISTRIQIAHGVGIAAASLCINRRLYHIASVKTVTITKSQKRRAIFVDLAIGLGIPIVQLPLAYVSQGHRFDIYEQAGCFSYIHPTPVAFVLVWAWPFVIGVVSATYCFLTIRAFYRRRSLFKELLSANNNLNSNRYFRLMGLAATDMACTIPFSIWVIRETFHALQPWKSWHNVHLYFSRVGLFPAIIWRNNTQMRNAVEMSRWFTVACAFVFFGFFGFADEARKNYRSAYESLAKRVGYSTGSMRSGATTSTGAKTGFPGMSSFGKGIISFGKGSIPTFVRQQTTRTEGDLSSSSYTEKRCERSSIGSVFDNVKSKELTSTTLSSSSSGSSRSPSPAPALFTPPTHTADAPTSVPSPHDIV